VVTKVSLAVVVLSIYIQLNLSKPIMSKFSLFTLHTQCPIKSMAIKGDDWKQHDTTTASHDGNVGAHLVSNRFWIQ
jgi:hypothetical protein